MLVLVVRENNQNWLCCWFVSEQLTLCNIHNNILFLLEKKERLHFHLGCLTQRSHQARRRVEKMGKNEILRNISLQKTLHSTENMVFQNYRYSIVFSIIKAIFWLNIMTLLEIYR